MPIPDFNPDGFLPMGLHLATWQELRAKFGTSEHRRSLLRLLHSALTELKRCGCVLAYIDGSFTTNKVSPSDYDMCWSTAGVDDGILDPVLLTFSDGRKAMKAKYGGDIFPADCIEGKSGKVFLDFFQIVKDTGDQKGIIELDLRGLP